MHPADHEDVVAGYESGPLIMRIGVWAILGGELRCAITMVVFSVVFGAGFGLVMGKHVGGTVALALATLPLNWWLTRDIRRSAVLVPNDWSPWRRRPRPVSAAGPLPSKDHAVWGEDAVLLGPQVRVGLMAVGFVVAGAAVWVIAPLLTFVFAVIGLYHVMVACSTLRAAGELIVFRNFLSSTAVTGAEVEVFVRELPRMGAVRSGTRSTLWIRDANGFEHRVMATMQAAFFDPVPSDRVVELQRLLSEHSDTE